MKSIKIAEVGSAMKLWQLAAKKHGQASEEAKRTFLDYRYLSNRFTRESNVRLTGYLLGPIEIPAEPEWIAEANRQAS